MIAIMRMNSRMVATVILLAALVACRQAGPATNAATTDLQTFLDETLDWHRKSELTRYAQFLRELATETAQPGSHESYARTEERIDSFTSALIDRAAPQAAAPGGRSS